MQCWRCCWDHKPPPQLRAAKEEELGQLMEQGAAREAQLQEGAYAQLEALAYERDSLQAELDSVLEFKQHKVSQHAVQQLHVPVRTAAALLHDRCRRRHHPQAECDAALAAVREEAVGLREALEAQRGQLERHYTGQHARMRKEYEQVRPAAAVLAGGPLSVAAAAVAAAEDTAAGRQQRLLRQRQRQPASSAASAGAATRCKALAIALQRPAAAAGGAQALPGGGA